jgi:hypothetical protein
MRKDKGLVYYSPSKSSVYINTIATLKNKSEKRQRAALFLLGAKMVPGCKMSGSRSGAIHLMLCMQYEKYI